MQRTCEARSRWTATAIAHLRVMQWQEPMTVADLRNAWRDAIRAAELAERLADTAAAALRQAEQSARVSADIAQLAEDAGEIAFRVAERARGAATEAAAGAAQMGAKHPQDAALTAETLRECESEFGAQYHRAEAGDDRRHD